MSDTPNNPFLQDRLGAIYVRTALPIIFVMSMNGLLAIADALFLGHFVGPDALAAVTLMFPIYMLIVALATLVSSGMSSLLARHLGGQRMADARAVYAGAHGLALAVGAVLIALFFGLGGRVALLVAGGNAALADMGLIYLRITVLFAPVMFVLSVNSDALRNEGRVGFMAAMSLLVSIANIVFNYVLIAQLNMGVAGSAYGTALANALAFAIILGFRLRGRTDLRPSAVFSNRLTGHWRDMLALGAPQSLNFLGLALGSAAVIGALQWVGAPQYEATVSAYGIVTRVMTFGYLPLLGVSYAMQTITGNNYGAQAFGRSDTSLRIAMTTALLYCATVQAVLMLFPAQVGAAFVGDPLVIAEVARILPVIVALFFATGPLMMIAMHFQAIGDARRAALLGLSKPYAFALPLTFALAAFVGEIGIWMAGPLAEILLFVLTATVLALAARGRGLRWGLFQSGTGERP